MISVLYVDDEPDLIELVQLFLERAGDIRVTGVTSAQNALAMDIGSFDTIISDYLMPDMDGIAFLKAVRQQTEDIPFLLFTGKGREEVVIEAINNGADSYLQKGGDPETQFAELAHRIRRTMRRKRSEAGRLQSEEMFLKLFMANPSLEAISELDTGALIDVNDTYIQTTGYTREELIGKTNRELGIFVDYADRERMAEVLVKEGIVRHIESRIRTKSGEIRTLEFTGQRIRIGDRDLLFSQAVDITDRKLAEKALRESEGKFRGMAERISDMVLLVDKDFNLTYVSPSFTRLTGKSEKELLGIPLPLNPLKPEDQEKVRAAFRENQALKTTGPLEITFPTPGQGSIILEFHGVPIQKEGIFEGVQLLAHDITSLRRTQDELRSAYEQLAAAQEELRGQYDEISKSRREVAESEEQYRTLFESATNAIIIGGRSSIINCNHAAETLFGCTREQIVNASLIDLSPERQPDGRLSGATAREKIEAALSGTPQFFEWIHKKSDQTTFHAEVSLNRILIRGEYLILGIVRDVTERKKAEEEIRESENKFATVFKYSPVDHTLVSATDGIIIDVNDAFARDTGYSREEAIGKTTDQLQLFPDRGEREKLIPLFRSGQDISGMLVTCRGRSGEVKACLFSARTIVMAGKSHILSTVEDITERKKAEDALHRSQQMLAEAMDLARLVNWEYDVASDLFTFNDRFYALYGTTAEREGGTRMSSETYAREFVHPDDRHMVGEEVQRALTTTDPKYFAEIEHRIIRRDGAVRHIVVRIRLDKDADGKTVRTHGANQDITDTRKAEEAVWQSEAKYRLLAENVHDVIFTADMDMNLTYISPSVMALRGFTADEAITESLHNALTPASLEVLTRSRDTGIERIRVAAPVLPSSTMELEFFRKDGSTVWTETVVTLAHDENKKPIGVVGVIRDITQRKQVENALMESEEKFRSLVETSPGMIWEIDISGKIHYISPMVKEILGHEPEGLVGENFKTLILKQFWPIFQRALATMASTSSGPLLPFEIIARHRDGHDLVLEIRPSRVLGIEGTVIGFRGVAYDTTRRKKAEEALKRANRQLNLLGSITRHDLLNKITVILGNLKLVERGCASPEEEEHLKKIRYATSAIKSQIEFTRVYQNLGTHDPQWIALDSVMPRPHVPPSVTMKTGVQDIEIMADPMLEKVFFNLIDNSIHHGEHVTEIHVTARKSGDDLVILWEDNGAGIDAEDKEHIFKRSFGKNTGLGMFLAREILSLTNIQIRETGVQGKGARFEITVPKGAYRNRDQEQEEG
ncbi:PAS domain S-box protein [Methanoregula sp.]|uniref:PAS domain S-box protein n=1 Tax=Methanoregula sp. TaxID=2052170 RepID=UPI00261A84C4|nr:PAS domain S-box protein [Methanoregula sp.]MDD5142218.1 PAS domain S-box protein [Methanoregula sp.]